MVLATWWYEDGQPELQLGVGMTVESPVESDDLCRISGIPNEEFSRRQQSGNRPYLAFVDGKAVSYGWVATRQASIGELNLEFELPAGQRYLWDFGTVPGFRGRGLYPRLLAEIIRRECPPATRLWIIHAPENLPSGLGMARAGFVPAAELSLDRQGAVVLAPLGNHPQVDAACELLGLPLVGEDLDPCWTCGGCACSDSQRAAGTCCCAIVPSKSA